MRKVIWNRFNNARFKNMFASIEQTFRDSVGIMKQKQQE